MSSFIEKIEKLPPVQLGNRKDHLEELVVWAEGVCGFPDSRTISPRSMTELIDRPEPPEGPSMGDKLGLFVAMMPLNSFFVERVKHSRASTNAGHLLNLSKLEGSLKGTPQSKKQPLTFI